MKTEEKQNSVERFSNRVENYVKYRPHYPREIIICMKEEMNMKPASVIADIGSGPGISSEHFIQNGNTVYGIEPNDAMREAAEKIYGSNKNFISIKGTAESTGLPDDSVDFILAGQAFHWFDQKKSRAEFKRVLKKDGYLVLMWNEKINSEGLMESYFGLLDKYGTDYHIVKHENVDDEGIEKFFTPDKMIKKVLNNHHELNYEGIEGRLLSSSYIPLEGDNFNQMINDLKKMYDAYEHNGKVVMSYETRVYWGHLS